LKQDTKAKKAEKTPPDVEPFSEGFEKRIAELQAELNKTRNELHLKGQMYEGLKSQYAELEKELEKALPAAQQKDKPGQPPQGQVPLVTKETEGSPDKSVASLLQDLQRIQPPPQQR
jgi:chromosome segregation ATPase